jgi:hypothetical protein
MSYKRFQIGTLKIFVRHKKKIKIIVAMGMVCGKVNSSTAITPSINKNQK